MDTASHKKYLVGINFILCYTFSSMSASFTVTEPMLYNKFDLLFPWSEIKSLFKCANIKHLTRIEIVCNEFKCICIANIID